MTLNELHRYSIAFFLLSFANLMASTVLFGQEEESLWWDKFETHTLRIPSFDGTELATVLFTPKEKDFPGERPGLIFVNSWSLNEHEYNLQARKFAGKGYIVLSYATRGFSSSGGRVTVAGPNDLADVSSVIDWMETHTQLDSTRLGMAGVSYGAGIALLAVANDPRVKTAVAMSGWGNLEQALYGNETIREVWLNLLLVSGKILGRLDPEIEMQTKRLRSNSEIDKVRSWTAQRSPLHSIDKINARKAPIMLANSYQDGLFPPSQMRAFYEQLQGPKAFYLDNGVHASSAIPGLLGLPSPVWNEVHLWIDGWLLNAPTDIRAQNPISFQTSRGREYFANFPALLNKQNSLKLNPVNSLSDTDADFDSDCSSSAIVFQSDTDSGATSGIPLISDSADAIVGLHVQKRLSLIDRRYAAIYTTDRLPSSLHLRGSPQINVWLGSHQGPLQLVAYLYDRDSWGIGTLITHGVFGQRTSTEQATSTSIDLNIMSYDVPAGHRLVLVIDSKDPLYTDLNPGKNNVELIHDGNRVTTMAMPLVP